MWSTKTKQRMLLSNWDQNRTALLKFVIGSCDRGSHPEPEQAEPEQPRGRVGARTAWLVVGSARSTTCRNRNRSDRSNPVDVWLGSRLLRRTQLQVPLGCYWCWWKMEPTADIKDLCTGFAGIMIAIRSNYWCIRTSRESVNCFVFLFAHCLRFFGSSIYNFEEIAGG